VILILATLAVAGLTVWLWPLIARDPFSNFKQPDKMADIGIQLENVQMKHYAGNKLMGVAQIDKINVRQDRQFMDFVGVHDGHVSTPKGDVAFTADEATFNVLTHQLNVIAGAHVTNKDMAVSTAAFMYDENTSTMSMPGEVSGKLYEGNFQANGLTYNSKDDSYEIREVNWVGIPPKSALAEFGGQDEQVSKPWKIHGHAKSYATNDKEHPGMDVWTDASATDGDVLVKAPHLERDRHTDVLTATGKVYYFGEKANMVCEKAVIYRKEKRSVLSGNVHMLVKPKDQQKLVEEELPPFAPPSSSISPPTTTEPQQQKDLDDELRSSKTARKYPTHVKADQIEYWYAKGNRHAVITGHPEAYQELAGDRWRRIVTHEGLYDGEKDELTMKSSEGKNDTRMVDKLGDDFTAKWIKVGTQEDEDAQHWEAEEVSGTFYPEDEDVNTQGKKTGGTTAPATTPATTPTTTPPANPNPAAPTPVQPAKPTTGGGGGQMKRARKKLILKPLA